MQYALKRKKKRKKIKTQLQGFYIITLLYFGVTQFYFWDVF